MLRFVSPFDGQVITDSYGVRKGSSLSIPVRVSGDGGLSVKINDVPALSRGGQYFAEIPIDGYRNTLTVCSGTETATIGIYWLPEATGTYAFSVDDNILFLKDLAENKYSSIFSNPYLRVFKDVHEDFGTKFRFNLFYSENEIGGFNLSQMPDRYKDEFLANSGWLRFSFHSNKEFPEYPYLNASYTEMRDDCRAIQNEIIRFAGKNCLESAATVHFGKVSEAASRAIRSQGVTMLMDNDPAYEHKVSLGYWMDHQEQMMHGFLDCVLNLYSPEGIPERLDHSAKCHPYRSNFEILIHEQYFYPDYPRYMPDFEKRVLSGVKWCTEHDLKPVFNGDVIQPW